MLEHLLPIDAGLDPETLRACTLKVGADLRDAAPAEPATAAAAITLTLDSTFIRSCEVGQRHLEVHLGKVERSDGGRQVFAAVARTDTAIEALIRRGLADVGKTTNTELTAFTDGCSGLRSTLVNAGVTRPPGLDWFHIAMRLQHAKKTACTLPADTPERENARAMIVAEVDRLHWRIWNGKAKDAKITLERIRQVMPVFQGDGDRKRDPSSRRLWTALREIDRYLTSQIAWLVNYAKRHRAGLRVGTSLTEGTANFLVNRRMNKAQQMRWSRRDADLLLQVRCAGINGKLGSSFGQLFHAVDPASELAMAA
jgi:ethanolamine utilization microcompartment shell protein EutS